jgi:hypothetical protein
MVRLTVLYTLAADQDEQAFLAWRLGEHQSENASQPGVLRTDFGVAVGAWPDGSPIPYRFMTTADWPDMESFRAAFYSEEQQAALRANAHIMGNALFLVTEILASNEETRPQ